MTKFKLGTLSQWGFNSWWVWHEMRGPFEFKGEHCVVCSDHGAWNAYFYVSSLEAAPSYQRVATKWYINALRLGHLFVKTTATYWHRHSHYKPVLVESEDYIFKCILLNNYYCNLMMPWLGIKMVANHYLKCETIFGVTTPKWSELSVLNITAIFQNIA